MNEENCQARIDLLKKIKEQKKAELDGIKPLKYGMFKGYRNYRLDVKKAKIKGEIKEIEKEIEDLTAAGVANGIDNNVATGVAYSWNSGTLERTNSSLVKNEGKLQLLKDAKEKLKGTSFEKTAFEKSVDSMIKHYNKKIEDLKKCKARVEGKQRTILFSRVVCENAEAFRIKRAESIAEFKKDRYDNMITYRDALRAGSISDKIRSVGTGLRAALYKKISVERAEARLASLRNGPTPVRGARRFTRPLVDLHPDLATAPVR